MIRTVFFDFSNDPDLSPGYQFGGYEQEHGATTLQVQLPDGFLSPAIRFVHFDFQTALGETVAGEPVDVVDGRVSTLLFQQLMQAGLLQFQVIARGEDDAVIAKTAIGKLIIEKSTYGDPVVLSEQPYRVDQAILDCLAQAQDAAAQAEDAAAQAEADKQEILAQMPWDGENIAAQALDLRHFSEADYRLLRRMSIRLSPAGTELMGITTQTGDDLSPFYFVGEYPYPAAYEDPDAPAVIHLYANGTYYTVVGTQGKPVAYADIPRYGIYHIQNDTQMVLLDAKQPLSAGEVTTAILADDAVTTDKIADNTVCPQHTTFISPAAWQIESSIANIDFTMGSSQRIAVIGEGEYLLFENYALTEEQLAILSLTVIDDGGAILQQIPVASLEIIRTDDTTYSQGRYVHLPAAAAYIYLRIEPPEDDPDMTMEVHYTVCSLRTILTIPQLQVATDHLAEGAVTLSKLSADVRETLSGAINRRIVSVLPPDEGTVLAARAAEWTAGNTLGDNVVGTNWFSLDAPADLTPVTGDKQLRMTVTLSRTDGQPATYQNGMIELRRYENSTEYKLSYGMGEYTWIDGENTLCIPLNRFTPQDSTAWKQISQVRVYTYAKDTDAATASYEISVSDLRIVDTAAQQEITLNTIYMVPSVNAATENVYDEFMYINGAWEQIGSTALDMSNYYTKAEIDSKLAALGGDAA